jgi:hypothetical protein
MNVDDRGIGTVTCTLPDIPFSASIPFTVDVGTVPSGFTNVDPAVSSKEAHLLPGSYTFNDETRAISGADVELDLTEPASAPPGPTWAKAGLNTDSASSLV